MTEELQDMPEFQALKREAGLKREVYRVEFAKAALTGLLAYRGEEYLSERQNAPLKTELAAQESFRMADAMLVEMERSR